MKRKLAELEQKGSELKQKLAEDKEDGKDRWESFKAEINRDTG